ncbi:hypothetical protein XHV734_0598 [Xanthomonas hortorum pv. vitians]|nr:hypothetical protein XHV734_0598 [Xanthomonas hortorum pv. vitians]
MKNGGRVAEHEDRENDETQASQGFWQSLVGCGERLLLVGNVGWIRAPAMHPATIAASTQKFITRSRRLVRGAKGDRYDRPIHWHAGHLICKRALSRFDIRRLQWSWLPMHVH